MSFINNRLAAVLAAAIALSLSGCDQIDELIENDSNIGKNMPALGTVDQSALTEMITQETTSAVKEDPSQGDMNAEKAALLLSEMTAEEKIGQLLLARYPENPVEVMEQYQLGGYTMYAENFEDGTVESIKAETDEVKLAAKITPFIAVDEEGGTVVRISKYSQYRSEPFSSPQLLYKRGGVQMLAIDAEEKAMLLRSLGINLNLGPVCDVTADEGAYIFPRTLGQNASDTSDGIAAIVEASNKYGLASCLKHFPGYGSSSDTHSGSAEDSRSLAELLSCDFLPFSAGISVSEDELPAVMVNHNVYTQIDDTAPASLSPAIHELLRNQLGFTGVIVTDDLGMDAIAEYSGEAAPSVAALLAGNDMLCVSDHAAAYSELTAAYDEGVITDEILNEHVARILVMKLQYGIIEDRPELPEDKTDGTDLEDSSPAASDEAPEAAAGVPELT